MEKKYERNLALTNKREQGKQIREKKEKRNQRYLHYVDAREVTRTPSASYV